MTKLDELRAKLKECVKLDAAYKEDPLRDYCCMSSVKHNERVMETIRFKLVDLLEVENAKLKQKIEQLETRIEKVVSDAWERDTYNYD
jgi:thiaminase